MHFIGTIIIGFIVGVVAKLITPGKDPSGFIITTLMRSEFEQTGAVN